ncbi:MAG: [FeFe] hydrogenase H-cluster maturation GTPase HydF [Acutalibacteraceae bacterium]|nr:[FeFe] hydrogenase H-cluster maturation GTPase HydF [Acutalibacteraceae bacterium]
MSDAVRNTNTLNDTPSGERVHIGFFGIRNAGKSSVVNAVTNQELALVSDVRGTTTDPVLKAMELLPIGPVVIIDTPGIDDEGALGALRVERTRQALRQTDVAVLVADSTVGLQEADRELLDLFEEKQKPYVIAFNKTDLLPGGPASYPTDLLPKGATVLPVSAKTGDGIEALKEHLGKLAGTKKEKFILKDLVEPGDFVVLVIPIDASAPKGRIILPQQQVLRELLDLHCNAICVQASDLKPTLDRLCAAEATTPKLVVTDSQAFKSVMKDTPSGIPVTSFSILFARYKGDLEQQVLGAAAMRALQPGDRVLISEGCTHHRQCQDIGTVKLPGWLEHYTGFPPQVDFTQGGQFPEDLSPYRLIIHCGGCMLNETAMKSRLSIARDAGVPMTNYGVAIAEFNGTLKRSLEVFPEILKLLESE